MTEIIPEELTYPGIAKYAVMAMADDQLSGGEPAITCKVTRSTVSVYDADAETWVSKAATNPAWAFYDLAVNTDYGGTWNHLKMDWDAISAWADYCDEDVDGEPRFTLNLVIDTQMTLWAGLQQIARIGRAAPLVRGSELSVVVDRPGDPQHAFALPDIKEGSFSLTYLQLEDRANAVEITYMDEDANYTRQTVAVYSLEYNESDQPDNKTSVTLWGCTRRAQAIREGAFLLNSTKFLTRVIEFDVDVQALPIEIGDRFYFAHDAPMWASSGLLFSATSNMIILDRPVTLLPGTSYSVIIKLADDTIEEKEVQGVAVETTTGTLTLTSAFSGSPAKYDTWIFGPTTTYKRIYTVTGLERNGDLQFHITGAEYNENIYTDTGYVIDDPTWTPTYQEAVRVYAHERIVMAGDGTYQSVVDVSWHPSKSNQGTTWEVWLENLTSGSAPILVGTTGLLHHTIGADHFTFGLQYKIYVAPVGNGPYDTGNNTATLTIQGFLAPPSDVASFSGTFDKVTRMVWLQWGEVDDIDLSHYEIRYGGTGWADATVINAHATGASYGWYVEDPTDTTLTFYIKAVDNSGVYSTNAASCNVTVDTDATDLPVPTGLTLSTWSTIAGDGTDHVYLRATWDPNAEAYDEFSHYDIRLTNVGTTYTEEYYSTNNEYTWEVLPNTEYSVKVRARDTAQNVSAWCSPVNQTSAKDQTAPDPPTISVTEFFTGLRVNITHNGEYDLDHFEIYRHTSNYPDSASKVGETSTTTHVDRPPAYGVKYYYWVKAVDTSDNKSGFSSVASGQMLQVDGDDIAANAILANHIKAGEIQADHLDALCVTAAKIAADAVTASKIDVSQLSDINPDAGTITAGTIQSGNWGASAGMRFLLGSGTFQIGGSSSPKLSWDGATLKVVGEVQITGGTPTGSGLWLTNTYFGYYNGASWANYFKSDGDALLGDKSSDNYVEWDQSTGTLTLRGDLEIETGSIVADAVTERDYVAISSWSSYYAFMTTVTSSELEIDEYSGNFIMLSLYIDNTMGGDPFDSIAVQRTKDNWSNYVTLQAIDPTPGRNCVWVYVDSPGSVPTYKIKYRIQAQLSSGGIVGTLEGIVFTAVEYKR